MKKRKKQFTSYQNIILVILILLILFLCFNNLNLTGKVTQEDCYCTIADINKDKIMDVNDLNIIADCINKKETCDKNLADINKDNVVNELDLSIYNTCHRQTIPDNCYITEKSKKIGLKKDSEFLEEAIKNKDINSCNKIENENIKNTCYDSYATQYADSDACSKVSENYNFCKNKASLFKETFEIITCADGNLDSGEECDDGNKVNCDGCSFDCKIEKGWQCGDSILNTNCGEECDGSDDTYCPGKCKKDCTCGVTLSWIEFVKEFDGSDCGNKLKSGWSLEADNLGNLYVTDGYYDTIKKFNSDSVCINEIKNIKYVNNLAIDNNNKKYILYEAGNDRNILQLNKDDKEERKWNIGYNLERIFVIKDKIYILHPSKKTIFRYSLDRKSEATYTVEFTQDIAYDSKNNRIIAAGYGKITAYDMDFKKIKDLVSLPERLSSGLSRIYHVSVNNNGDIYISDERDSIVRIVDENGKEVGIIGIAGECVKSQGNFCFPRDITIKNNYLYVADAYNNRIQKFKINTR